VAIMTTPLLIRVMLVDDHTLVRRGLATFLKVYPDLELVGEAEDGESAIHLCAELMPDVLLMDMILPGMDGATATHTIRRQFPSIQVLMLTSFKDAPLVKRTLQAGAIGYILKDISAEDLARAIRAAHAGYGTLSHQVTQASMTRSLSLNDELTEREREVLMLLVQGLSNTAIAKHLLVSPSTIKSHVGHILAKLGVASRTEAAALAVRVGLTP
jgi:NarL family two-component system response regulator LiaR